MLLLETDILNTALYLKKQMIQDYQVKNFFEDKNFSKLKNIDVRSVDIVKEMCKINLNLDQNVLHI